MGRPIAGLAGKKAPNAVFIPLFLRSEKTDQPWLGRSPAAKRVCRIVPDPRMMTADPVFKAGDSIRLALFDDAVFDAKISTVTCYPNGSVGMSAPLTGDWKGTVFISYCEGQMRISVDVVGGADYYVRYNSKTGEHYAIEVDRQNSMLLEGAEPLLPSAEDAMDDASTDTLSAAAALTDSVALDDASSESTVVDVMIVYTPAALAAEGGTSGMNNNIALAMQTANAVHANSNTKLYLNLVYSGEISYEQSGDSSTDLYRLRLMSDNYMDEVHTLRDLYGADLVCLYEDEPGAGGQGYLLSSTEGSAEYAFSLARVQQSDWTYTVVHEWGHNMGCHHSKAQTTQPGPGLYSYSAGWQWDDTKASNDWPYTQTGYCSVMTYEDSDNDDVDEFERVAYFSSPEILYTGDSINQIGDVSHGDNARTIRQIKAVVASYRAASSGEIVLDDSTLVLNAVAGESDGASRAISNAGSGELVVSLSDGNFDGSYSWRASDSANGPEYQWIDISASGTSVALADDGESALFDLDFSFPFYDENYSQFQIAANGVVSLSVGAVSFQNYSLPSQSVPAQSFCLFWDDLNPAVGGSILYQVLSSRLVVSYLDVPRVGSADTVTCQLVLYPDGRIFFQYQALNGAGGNCTVGIMDDQSSGPVTKVSFDTAYLKDLLAIEFDPVHPRWFSYSVADETVAAGQTVDLLVMGDASDLSAGDYYATLTVSHNDSSRSAVEIPVVFHVTAVGDVDGDGLPDEWELQYFEGVTNANPAAVAANGINTVWETYIAGLDPTDSNAVFQVSLSAGPVLAWSAVSGRVYSVWTATNLVENFQPLATNIFFPQSSYTGTVYRAEQFYRVDVELP